MNSAAPAKNWTRGFTLIEALVTILVIGVLAAIVIPAITSRVGAGDSTRVYADLNNIRTAIENFDLAVRAFPGDLDDLVNAIATDDADIASTTYTATQTAAWAGPYIEKSVSSTAGSPFFDAFPTGYNGAIDNKLSSCNIASSLAGGSCDATNGNYVTILIRHLTPDQMAALNDLIDGVGESNSSSAGKFRMQIENPVENSLAWYYAAPFK